MRKTSRMWYKDLKELPAPMVGQIAKLVTVNSPSKMMSRATVPHAEPQEAEQEMGWASHVVNHVACHMRQQSRCGPLLHHQGCWATIMVTKRHTNGSLGLPCRYTGQGTSGLSRLPGRQAVKEAALNGHVHLNELMLFEVHAACEPGQYAGVALLPIQSTAISSGTVILAGELDATQQS